MMIDFTNQGNQSNLLYNASSIQSTSSINDSSAITTSSATSVTSSISSSEPGIIGDPFSLSFLTENQHYYFQLLEDLSIVDNMQETFEHELDSNIYDKQVLDIARHVASQRQILDTLLESESIYVSDLFNFQEIFAFKLRGWIDGASEKDAIAKLKDPDTRRTLEMLFTILHSIAIAHTTFLKDLKARLELWGPTQLISDIFQDFYNSLTVYEPFMQHHSKFVMILDTLYKIPSFVQFVETTLEDNVNRHEALKIHDIIHYIYAPLHRLNVYTKALKQLSQYSNPAYPDYGNLLHVFRKFKLLDKEQYTKVQDCQSHLMVLEAFRTIKECPIYVTDYRRLLLFAHLVKVDLDDITLTNDIRMYFLYNDSLIYCKKQKEKKGYTEKKLAYKGKLSLRGADIRQLAPTFLAKMVEVKKPFFRLGKKSSGSDSASLPGAEAFGFEIITSEINLDALSPLHQNYQSASASGGAPIRRRHVLRTRSQAEQTIWYEAMRKAIRIANSLPP